MTIPYIFVTSSNPDKLENIQQLENELGCPLFERLGKNISLSEYGRKFLPYALDIEKKIEYAKVSICDEYSDYAEIRIGILESLCITYMPDLVTEFHKEYPNINIIIKIGTYNELSEMLNHNQIDLLWTFDHMLDIPSWSKAFECKVPIHLISAPSHSILDTKNCNLWTLSLSSSKFCHSK